MKTNINLISKIALSAVLAIFVCPTKSYGQQITASFSQKIAQYDLISSFSGGFAKVAKSGKYGFIDKEGHEVVACGYDEAGDFHDMMAFVKQGGKYGYVDDSGKLIIPIQYDKVQNFSEGLAWVCNDETWCCIDKSNKKIFMLTTQSIERSEFKDGLSRISVPDDAPAYFIDNNGKTLDLGGHTPDYTFGIYSDQLILCTNEDADGNGKSYYIDRNGNIVVNVAPKYSYFPFVNGLAPFVSWEDSKMGYINKKGEPVIPLTIPYQAFDDLESMGIFYNEEDMIRTITLTEEGELKYGFVDTSGKQVIPYQYNDAFDFTGGLAAVCNESGKWGFVDKKGNVVIPFQYDSVSSESFQDGFALVSKDNKYGYVDKKGNDTFTVK